MALVDICSSNGCNREWPTIAVSQSTKTTITACLKDRLGNALELNPLMHTVTFIAKEWVTDEEDFISKACVITDGDNGTVSCVLDSSDVPYAGIWLGEFTVTQYASDDSAPDPEFTSVVVERCSCYLEVRISHKANAGKATRPLSIFEVRMAIRDRCSSDNAFLDSLEFSDTEIAYAMQRPIDYWNEALPPLPHYTYTYASFPYKYNWTEATVGELLKMAGNNLLRNDIKLSAGGVTLDEKGRAASYLSLGAQMVNEYKAWVAGKKYSLNVNDCWGTTTLPDFE
jgi:hypothetical protein